MQAYSNGMRWIRRGVVTALALAALPGLVRCSRAAGATADAAKLLDRYIEVTGGKAAHDSFRSSVTKMTLTLPAQDLTFAVTLYQARPNQQYTLLESPITGKIESGVHGEVAWELSAVTGPRLKEGQEKADALRDATFDAMASWRDLYAKAELAGVDTVGGKVCDKVVLTPATGRPRTAYFDRASGLIQRYDASVESPAGTVAVQTLIGDYRKEGALLMPHRTETKAMGQKRVMTVDSMAVIVDLPAGRFDPPAEVSKLLEAKK
jgi:hypothetical protein